MAVDTVDLANLNRLLAQMLELPEAERSAWLATLPADAAHLRPTLEKLLKRSDSTGFDDFLRTLPKLEDGAAVPPSGRAEGDQIGPYRLLRTLGQGGMGTVWLAERADGTLKRKVALKLPLIAGQPQMRERLLRERDLLASLEHPNIARLYDAGIDASGQPYLALEYVEGEPIDAYCSANRLDVKARLAVFVDAARAVAYAHARLTLHRDIKPSNILVSSNGQARLLDFGVAKLLEDGGTHATELTRFGGDVLTPAYASPEQILGQPLTVASDVYSLGVVLYELLAGVRPYKLPRDSRGALEDAIVAVEPQPPSAVVAERALRRQLAGDLDTILLKTLKKAPAERYATVAAFIDDIERHLAGATVLARPDTFGYRLSKFVRKHRLALGVAAAIALALLGGAVPTAAVMIALALGVAVAGWQAKSAREQARHASQEARRAERVKQFVASMFTQATPRQGAGGVVTAADLLTAAAARIEQGLGEEPRVAAELGVLIGEGFNALGESTAGEALRVATVARTEREFGRQHVLSLRAKNVLNTAYTASARYDDAERVLARLVPDALAALPASARDAVWALRTQSFVQAKRDHAEASYASLRQAIDIGERELGPLHEDTIEAFGLLSNTYGRFGEFAAELAAAEEAMRRATAAHGHKRPHVQLTAVERWYAGALTCSDRPADAVRILRNVVRDQRALDTTETIRVQSAMQELPIPLMMVGQAREAIAIARRCVELEAQYTATDSDRRHSLHAILGRVLVGGDYAEEALQWLGTAAAMAQRLGNEPAAWTLRRGLNTARALALLGRSDEADHAARAVAAHPAAVKTDKLSEAVILQAFNARLQNRPADALRLAHEAVACAAAPGISRLWKAESAAELGRAHLLLGQLPEAETELARAADEFAKAQVPHSVRSSIALVGLAQIHLASGRTGEAEALLGPVVASWQDANPDSVHCAEAVYWLARCRGVRGDMTPAAEPPAAQHLAHALDVMERSRLPLFEALARDPLQHPRALK